MTETDVSIIIVSWNTKGLLKDCLQSIYMNTKSIRFEIIVVDNDSKDSSVEMVKRYFPKVILIENDKNYGFARAGNIGASKASGRYLLFLNSDTKIINDSIKKMVKCFEENKNISIVGAQLLKPDGSYQKSFSSFPSLKSELRNAFFINYTSKSHEESKLTCSNVNTLREVEQVFGTAMMIDSGLFSKTKGFDESYFMYGEDADLCFRARSIGRKIVLHTKAHVIHYGSKSTEQWSDRLLKHKIKNYNLFFRKHHPLFKYLWFGIIHFIKYTNGILLSLILIILRKNKTKTLLYFIKSLNYQILYFFKILIGK